MSTDGSPKLLERLQLGGNETEGGAEALALKVDVHAEAGEAGESSRRCRSGASSRSASAARWRGCGRASAGCPRGSGARIPGRSSRPLTRTTGSEPTVTWRSEAPRMTTWSSSRSSTDPAVFRSRAGGDADAGSAVRAGRRTAGSVGCDVGSMDPPDGCYRQGNRCAKGGWEIPRKRGSLPGSDGRYLPLSHCTLLLVQGRSSAHDSEAQEPDFAHGRRRLRLHRVRRDHHHRHPLAIQIAVATAAGPPSPAGCPRPGGTAPASIPVSRPTTQTTRRPATPVSRPRS